MKQPTVQNSHYLGIPGCYSLFRFFVYIGKKFYVLAEKCIWYSKERESKRREDELWKKKMAVSDAILEDEEMTNEFISIDDKEVSTKEVIEKVSESYIDVKEQLEFAHKTIYALWEAHSRNDREKSEEIFLSLGFTEYTQGE